MAINENDFDNNAAELRTRSNWTELKGKMRQAYGDLTDDDLEWLRATFTPEHLTVFNKGGHLGNLFNPAVQKSILAALTPMRPPDIKPEAPAKN